MRCDNCKKNMAVEATSFEAYNHRFVIKFNEALAELQDYEDPTLAFSTFMVNVDDVVKQQALHNNLTLSEFYLKWAEIKKKVVNRGEK